MGVMPLTASKTASAPKTVDAGADARDLRRGILPTQVRLGIYRELAAVEPDWRRFQALADCTVFQTFDWLDTWQKHIGRRRGAGRRLSSAVSPTATSPSCCRSASSGNTGCSGCAGSARICATITHRFWRAIFRQRVDPDRFLTIWEIVQAQLQSDPQLRHDWIDFTKMPKEVGGQVNPFTHLKVTLNASGVHLAHLTDDWEKFYVAKRSSSTRRRDRTKRAHLAKHGDIRFVTATNADDARRSVETLIEQKSGIFRAQGNSEHVRAARHREFYLDLATNPATTQIVHIARTDVGDICAAATSPSSSATPITTCWQVTSTTSCRVTGRAACICAK